MSNPAARRDRQDAVLAELSELGLTLARELHGRALAAETPQDADRLALAFQRVSRGVRQTFALELKIERARGAAEREDACMAAEDAAQAERDARPSIVDQLNSPVAHRKSRVRNALTRLIWQEAEGDEDEIEILDDDLETRLHEASFRDDFLDLPIESLILEIKSDMGLSGELRITACEAPRPAAPDPGQPDPGDPDPGDLVYDAAPPNTG